MRKIVIALGVVAVVAISGCASDKGIDETGYSKKPLVDRKGHKLKSADAKRLYTSARDFLLHGEPDQALPLYAEVLARFPFSVYAPQSQLETIDAHYQAEQYDQAVDSADHFIKQRPRNPHIDYVYYLRGLSNYKRNKPSILGAPPDKRNVVYLKQSFADFSILTKTYPDSVYAKDAQLHMIDVRNRLATFDLRVAEYYMRRHAYVAASRRADYIIKHYQGSTAVPRALEIMQQSYGELQLPGLAEDARSILQVSYPNYLLHRDEFYRQQAGDKPNYTLPAIGAAPAAGQPSDGQSAASGVTTGASTRSDDSADNDAATAANSVTTLQ